MLMSEQELINTLAVICVNINIHGFKSQYGIKLQLNIALKV